MNKFEVIEAIEKYVHSKKGEVKHREIKYEADVKDGEIIHKWQTDKGEKHETILGAGQCLIFWSMDLFCRYNPDRVYKTVSLVNIAWKNEDNTEECDMLELDCIPDNLNFKRVC